MRALESDLRKRHVDRRSRPELLWRRRWPVGPFVPLDAHQLELLVIAAVADEVLNRKLNQAQVQITTGLVSGMFYERQFMSRTEFPSFVVMTR